MCSASILCCNHVDDILGVFGIMLLEGRKLCTTPGAEITILLARVLGKLQCFGADYVLLCTQIYMCVERERTLFHIHVCVAIMCFQHFGLIRARALNEALCNFDFLY